MNSSYHLMGGWRQRTLLADARADELRDEVNERRLHVGWCRALDINWHAASERYLSGAFRGWKARGFSVD